MKKELRLWSSWLWCYVLW